MKHPKSANSETSTHHDVTFDILAFKLEVEEVVVGEVSELADFGCFIRIATNKNINPLQKTALPQFSIYRHT